MEPPAPPPSETPPPITIVVPPPEPDDKGWFSPVKWVSFLGAFLICLVLIAVLLVIVIDEARHAFQPGYTAQRVELYESSCVQRVDRDGKAVKTAASEPHRTRFSQKVDRFLLCANFTKLTVVGVEVSMEKILQTVDGAAAANQEALSLLADAGPSGSATEAGSADKALAERLSAVKDQLIETQEELAEIAATAPAGPDGDQGPWGVIASSDPTVAAAQETASFFAKRLPDFPAPQIYETRGRFRVVFPFGGEAAARVGLQQLIGVRNTGAYVRNLAQWCGGVPPQPVGGVIACY